MKKLLLLFLLVAALFGAAPRPAPAQIEAVTYKDTLSKTTVLKSYNFKGQYPRVHVDVKYDSSSAHNDTVRFYNVDAGDTTGIYLLDSANNRVPYLTNSGDQKYKYWRLDRWCPDIVIIKYSDSVIYTTKFFYKIKGVKQP